MHRNIFLRICTAAAIGLHCSTFAAAPVDKALDAALQGAWCNSDDGGRTCWGYDVFANGEVRSCGMAPGTRSAFKGASRYRIKGHVVCHTVTESNSPETMKLGDRFCVAVQHIDARSQVFKEESGDPVVIYRADPRSVRCPKAANGV